MEKLQKISDRFSKLTEQEQESIVSEIKKLLTTLETGVKDKQFEYHWLSSKSTKICKQIKRTFELLLLDIQQNCST